MAKKRKKIKPKKKRSYKKSRHRKTSRKAEELIHKTRMRIIGVGGGGGSIVSEIASQLKKVDFVVANTDLQALKEASKKARVFHFGKTLTHGLGCGMDPKCGKTATKQDQDKITKLFKGIDLVIFVACLGGGTGSGAAPEFAKIARDLGIMTFGIFTLPFKFEGRKRMQIAKNSLEKLIPNLNAVSIILNENIFQIINKDTPIVEAFSAVNRRLLENLRGLIEMIYLPGLINIDFADLKTILAGKGKLAYLNTVISDGSGRAEEAVKEVLRSPLNEYDLRGVQKLIFNITASEDLGMAEVAEISKTISDFNRRAKIIFGVCQNNDYKDKLKISLLGVGCGKEPKPKPKPTRSSDRVPRRMTGQTPKKPKPKPEPKPKKKRKPKSKPKPKTKPKKIPVVKEPAKPAAPEGGEPRPKKERESPKENGRVLIRKSALDLKREVEKTESDLLAREKVWDIPAFLRKQEEK